MTPVLGSTRIHGGRPANTASTVFAAELRDPKAEQQEPADEPAEEQADGDEKELA